MDGNDVSIDQEMVTLAETQLRFQAASSALSKKLQTIRDVLR
jgi:flagellar basal body rod protein FlgB